ncbi:MAG: hypothetical protein WCX82_02545 [archaeon]|jgi:predicted transcriptional regulator
MSENKDVLLKMLADEPRLYDVLNAKEYLKILEILEKDSQDLQNIKNIVGKDIYIKKDIILYNILDTLLQRDLVKKIKVNDNIVYFLTDKGKRFITLYTQTKQEFSLI